MLIAMVSHLTELLPLLPDGIRVYTIDALTLRDVAIVRQLIGHQHDDHHGQCHGDR